MESGINDWNRAAYAGFLHQWEWEWFMTARLHHGSFFCTRHLAEFRTRLLRQGGGQIGTAGIFIDGDTGPHMHVLLLGRFPGGKTLMDADEEYWASTMEKITGKSCIISRVDGENNRIAYVVKQKNTPEGRHELLTPWGRILNLKKH